MAKITEIKTKEMSYYPNPRKGTETEKAFEKSFFGIKVVLPESP